MKSGSGHMFWLMEIEKLPFTSVKLAKSEWPDKIGCRSRQVGRSSIPALGRLHQRDISIDRPGFSRLVFGCKTQVHFLYRI